MKIISIRGCNLASLAGPFEVSLEHGILKNAGIFAITGPTGSGKSTILDAICLALYDQIPRLAAGPAASKTRSATRYGKADRLKYHDVRTILRQGTSSAYAEVTFEGIDSRIYTARWAVNRARGKPRGKLQQQTLTLREASGGPLLTKNRSETLKRIEEKTGLNFEQFRRSVLLAQGEFSAFLKASPTKRAALLEQMTNTQIYSQLSIKAHQKARQSVRKSEQLQIELAQISTLPADEKILLEKKLIFISEKINSLEKEIQYLDTSIEWWHNHRQLTSLLEQARNVLSRSNADALQHSATQEKLACFKRVFPIYPLLKQKQSLKDNVLIYTREKSHQLAQINSLHKDLTHSKKQEKIQQLELENIQKKIQALKPDIARRNTIISEIKLNSEKIKQLTEQSESQQQLLNKNKIVLSKIRSEAESVQEDYDKISAWIKSHDYMIPLINNFSLVNDQLRRQNHLYKKVNHARNRVSTIEEKQAIIENDIAKLQSAQEAIIKNKALSTSETEELELRLKQETVTDCQLELKQLESQLALTTQLIAIRNELQQINNEIKKSDNQHTAITEKKNVTEKELTFLTDEIKKIKEKHSAAKNAINQVKLATDNSIKFLRGQLLSAEPCMVCGSPEHPWNNNEQISHQTDNTQDHYNTVSNHLNFMQKSWTDKEYELRQLIQNLSNIQHSLSQNHLIISKIKRQENELENELTELGIITENREQLSDIHQKIKTRASELKPGQLNLQSLQNQLQQKQKELITQEQELHNIHRKKEILLRRFADNAQRNGTEKSNLNQIQTEITAITISLNKHLIFMPDWGNQALLDTNELIQTYEKMRVEYQNNINKMQKYEAQSLILHKKNKDQQDKTSEASDHQQQIDHQVNTEKLKRDELESEKTMLEQRISSIAPETLTHRETLLKQQLEEIFSNCRRYEQAIHTLGHNSETNSLYLLNLEAELKKLNQSIDQFTSDAKLSQDDLELAQRIQPAWVQQQENTIRQIEIQRNTAQTDIDRWNDQLVQLTQSRPAHDESEGSHKKQIFKQQLRSLYTMQGKLRQLISSNLETEKKFQQKHQALKALEEECHVWQQIKSVIGSHDGSRLRDFVQNFTLEHLLFHTNRHLKEIAPRYQLKRNYQIDIDFEVLDREMGDQTRSVYSLSGGESFLISLALALGLASLSIEKNEIQTLFIDEGFSSLDSEALDMALSTLNSVQAKGRKIGIISHINELVERIGSRVTVTRANNGTGNIVEILKTPARPG